MEVTLLKRIYGVADGEVYPKWHAAGTVVSGDLAYSAVEEGCAVMKKKRQPIAPEHLKTGSVSQPDPALPKKTVPKRRGRPPKSSQ